MDRKGEGDYCKLGIYYETSPKAIILWKMSSTLFLLLLRKAVCGSKWVRDGEDSFDNSGLDWLTSKLVILLLHNLLYYGATSITPQHPYGKCDDSTYPVKM